MSDDYQPRKHDALVEPMFEALGADSDGQAISEPAPVGPAARPKKWRTAVRLFWLLAVLVAWLVYKFEIA